MTMIKQNFTIEEKQMERLRKYCDRTGLKMSVVIRQGIGLYFERESLKEKKNGSNKKT